jgi:uncharacterized OB-fold protein
MLTDAIHPERDYKEHLTSGRFMLLQSLSTGEYVFFPRVAVPRSGLRDLRWVEASGLGRVYASTVMRPKPPQTPYNVAIIELEEGPRMMSRVEGIAPTAVNVGLSVRAQIIEEHGQPLVVFTPSELVR